LLNANFKSLITGLGKDVWHAMMSKFSPVPNSYTFHNNKETSKANCT